MFMNSRQRKIKNKTGLEKLEPKHIHVHVNTIAFGL